MKDWFRHKPIRWKLTVASAAASAVALFIASVVFFLFDHWSFRKEMLHNARALTRVIGSNSTAALAFRDREVASRILGSLENEPHVLVATLYDTEHRRLAQYRRSNMPETWDVPACPEPGPVFKDGVLCICDDIVMAGDRLGSVQIVYSLRPLNHRVARYGLIVVLVMGLSFAIAWLLSFRLQQHVSSRIVRLQRTADRMSREDDFSVRAEGETTRDEIGALVRGFNQMLDTIEERDAELRKHQNKLRAMASQLTLTEESERRRVAEGLHDSICQILWVACLKLKMLSDKGDSPDAKELRAAQMLVDDALNQARSFTHQLSSTSLYKFGLETALERLAVRMSKEYGIDISFVDDGQDKPTTEDARVLLYRAVRELIMNSFKHAKAAHAGISVIRSDSSIRISVTDDGIGFDLNELNKTETHGGFGLFSIRERIAALGGTFTLESEPGQGTTAILEAPLLG